MIKYWWILIPLAAFLGYALKSYRTYQFQNIGEVLVRKVLTNNLARGSWHLLNNVTLQLENGTTQIDHVLVSRFGVFVIETKHYKGWIFGDESLGSGLKLFGGVSIAFKIHFTKTIGILRLCRVYWISCQQSKYLEWLYLQAMLNSKQISLRMFIP